MTSHSWSPARRWVRGSGLALLLACCLVGATPAPAAQAARPDRARVFALGEVGVAVVAPLPGPSWQPPLAGRLVVMRPFDAGLGRYQAGHRGVDLDAAGGETVRADGDGVVVYAGLLAGRGVVSIEHGGLRTTYEPVDPAVVKGQAVRTGQPVGTVQAFDVALHGGCARTCLHWGLRRGEDYLDPLRLLIRVRVRLLPVLGVPQP